MSAVIQPILNAFQFHLVIAGQPETVKQISLT